MPRGIYIRSEKAKENMSKAHTGVPLSNKHREALKGRPGFWSGKKRPEVREWLISKPGWKQSEESKKRISETHKGESHYRWVTNREKVKYGWHGDPEYKQWSKRIK